MEAVRARPVTALQIHYAEAGGITGHVMLLCMLLMYTTAHAPIRKQAFEAFWYTHHLAFIFILALYTHATGCFVRDTTQPYSPFAGELFWGHCIGYEGWRLTLWSGGLYFLERFWRVINSRRDTKITKVVMHPQGISPPSGCWSVLTSQEQWNFNSENLRSDINLDSGFSSTSLQSQNGNGIPSP